MKPWPEDIESSWPAEAAAERYRMTMGLMGIATKMQQTGWRIDHRRGTEHILEATERAARFRKILLDLTGLSPDALGGAGTGQTDAMKSYFWDTLQAPHVVFDKHTGRPQFNSEALVIYAMDHKDAAFSKPAAALYALRKNLKSVEFAQNYLKVAAANNGRIHFSWNPVGTKGERWSAGGKFTIPGQKKRVSLNPQQVPSKEPTFDFGDGEERLVHSLRDIFVPDEGCLLLKADYDQLELRLIAYTAGATKIIVWIDTDADTHMENAIVLFAEYKIPAGTKKFKKTEPGSFEELVMKCRDAAKPCAYGFSYQMPSGRGGDKYTQQYKQLKKIFPDLKEPVVNILASRFFKLHPEIKSWQFATARALEHEGAIQLTVNGATLYLPPSMRGKNQALNFQMQSTGGFLINRALVEIDRRIDWAAQEQIRGMIHDEVVGHAPYRAVERVARIIEEEMGRPAQIGETFAGIPAGADPGLNWGSTMALDKFLAAHPGLLPDSYPTAA